MGLVKKLMFIGIPVLIGVLYMKLTYVPPVPQLENKWWGKGIQTQKEDTSVRPFKINVPDTVLQDLKKRLEVVGLTPPLEGIGFQYGFNSEYLKIVLEFWRTKYNWREREAFLNSLPHFKTNVNGLDLHFIHAKPKEVPKLTEVLPLLLLHGWPGSVREFYDIIPLLTTPRKDVHYVFEVIAPSLPGYGFSEGASKPGLGPAQIALVMKNLMNRLGFEKFYVQGGDWGGIIGNNMATLFPKSVLGFHSNFCMSRTPISIMKLLLGSLWPTLIMEEQHVNKTYPLSSYLSFLIEESGYFHIQATKPDTVGVALQNSPAGLAAYILEKFSTATKLEYRTLPDGGLTQKFTFTDLLDNVMIYWVTESMTTAVRLYSEGFSRAQMALRIDSIPTKVLTACARFPHEISYTPTPILRDKFLNLVQVTDMPRGGHFAAFEEPQLLADDIFSAAELFLKHKALPSAK